MSYDKLSEDRPVGPEDDSGRTRAPRTSRWTWPALVTRQSCWAKPGRARRMTS